MEAYRKRNRGPLKGKLLPFYWSHKPSSTVQYTATDMKPNHYSSSPASVGFVVHQDYAINRSPKVTIDVSDNRCNFDDWYGHPADESVDIKAEIYIRMVQKRLMLERLNAEP